MRIKLSDQKNPDLRLLRVFRVWRGLRQKDLAARTALSLARISRIETGTFPVRQDELRRICAALELEPEMFRGARQ